jgi:hypothetical protein
MYDASWAVTSTFSYIEYIEPFEVDIFGVLGYVEWIGTPSTTKTEDVSLNGVLGYIEYIEPFEIDVYGVAGYIEYIEPFETDIHGVLGYIEWIGTPSTIKVEDVSINGVLGYLEYIPGWVSGSPPIPPVTGRIFGPAVWIM